jgi:hypothetical protein
MDSTANGTVGSELLSNCTLRREWSTNLFTNLADRSISCDVVSSCSVFSQDYDIQVNCLPIGPSALRAEIPAPVVLSPTGLVACSGTPVDPKSSFFSPLIRVS